MTHEAVTHNLESLRVGVLGPVRAWLSGRELPIGPPRQQAVLGMMAMRANRVVSRDELVDAVWGQQAPASAEGGVHTYVAGLRRVLEPGRSRRGPSQVLASAGGGYALRLDPGQVDAVVFERSLQQGRRLRSSGDLNGAIAALDTALGEWHGSAFAGVPGPFAAAERVRLAELRSAAAEERAEVLLDLGRHEQAVPELAALVAEHPLRERMRGLLMIALYRCGRQAEALQAFHDARQVLGDELGIDPGPELSRIHQQILALDPELEAPGRAPEPAAASTPAAAVLDPAPAQLPLEAPGFSGRHAELDRMLRVADPAAGDRRRRAVAGRRADHRDHRHGGGRQDDARDPVRPAGRQAFPGRPAVRQPARIRPVRVGDQSRGRAALLPRRPGRAAAADARGPGGPGRPVPQHAGRQAGADRPGQRAGQ